MEPKSPEPVGSASRAIARRDLEEVIRRAAELSLKETDTDDNLSETEVLRIATELGLPAHHVQRALFELPELKVRPRWYDDWYGPAVISMNRVVPSNKSPILRRIEDYLVTREYLQIVRRKGDTMAFMPADDVISGVARAFVRSGSQHVIARASRVVVSVHDVEEKEAHVHVDVDLSKERSSAVTGGVIGGASFGIAAGIGAALLAGAVAPEAFGVVPSVLAFGGAMTGSIVAGVSMAASGFQKRVHAARLELNGLLDRLEQGDRLEPPPAPWRRNLQRRLFGDRA